MANFIVTAGIILYASTIMLPKIILTLDRRIEFPITSRVSAFLWGIGFFGFLNLRWWYGFSLLFTVVISIFFLLYKTQSGGNMARVIMNILISIPLGVFAPIFYASLGYIIYTPFLFIFGTLFGL